MIKVYRCLKELGNGLFAGFPLADGRGRVSQNVSFSKSLPRGYRSRTFCRYESLQGKSQDKKRERAKKKINAAKDVGGG
jgi:hypothetical protein